MNLVNLGVVGKKEKEYLFKTGDIKEDNFELEIRLIVSDKMINKKNKEYVLDTYKDVNKILEKRYVQDKDE